jgi:hypothetical protein
MDERAPRSSSSWQLALQNDVALILNIRLTRKIILFFMIYTLSMLLTKLEGSI